MSYKVMKRIVVAFAIVAFALNAFACAKAALKKDELKPLETVADVMDLEANIKGHKMVVVYFSFTGNTEKVANTIAETFDLDTIKIEPVEPYDEDILDAKNKNSRALREAMSNPFDVEIPDEVMGETSPRAIIPETEKREEIDVIKELPAINAIDVRAYDTIFLGFPIWYGDAPKVIYTFIKDMKDKTIIPFCTSDNDTIASSEEALFSFADDSNRFITGRKFDANVTTDEIRDWVTKMSADMYER